MRHLLALLLLATTAFAQDVPLVVRENVKTVYVVDKLPFVIEAPKDAGFYDWYLPKDVDGEDIGDAFKVNAAPEGINTVKVRLRYAEYVDNKIKYKTRFGEYTFQVSKVTPAPTPTPDVKPAPIDAPGFRVLIVYESADKLTPKQEPILKSKIIRDYLDLRCIEVGNVKEWRIWDKDVDLAGTSKVWREGMAKVLATPGPLPKVLISNGVTGEIAPLPPDVPQTLELLKKYGGV